MVSTQTLKKSRFCLPYFVIALLVIPQLSEAAGVLWIGAHPDDESYVAPLLFDICNDQKKECRLLILTRGEKGNCVLPGGCKPDLPTVRTQEASASANYFQAQLTQWNLGDGTNPRPDGVYQTWSAKAGGSGKLISAVSNFIQSSRPDLILTWDPRHGSTCHPDHRATGYLTMLAANQAGVSPKAVLLVQAKVITGVDNLGKVWAGFAPYVPLDSSVTTTPVAPLWHAFVDILSLYKSQFTPAQVAAVSTTPDSARVLPLLRGDQLQSDDPRYKNLCP